MIHLDSPKNELQLNKNDLSKVGYKNESTNQPAISSVLSIQHDYTDRLTREEAKSLELELREKLPVILRQKKERGEHPTVTVDEISSLFHCKYYFARTRLKAMVKEGSLESEGGQGSIKEQFSLPQDTDSTEHYVEPEESTVTEDDRLTSTAIPKEDTDSPTTKNEVASMPETSNSSMGITYEQIYEKLEEDEKRCNEELQEIQEAKQRIKKLMDRYASRQKRE